MIKKLILQDARIEGNSILFSTYPITGLIGLVSFVDVTQGEDEDRRFDKFFRYSTDGVNYSEWITLSLSNLQALTFTEFQIISFELQYVKKQPLGENDLRIQDIEIQYNYQDNLNKGEIFNKTVFKRFFENDDVRVLNWYINVLNKLYERGLIASYIDRSNHNNSSIDYLQLWGSVAKFFAYYVVYARQYENFHQSESLLFEFLEQRGIKISNLSSIEEMNYIMSNFYKEIAKRGTIQIIENKEDGSLIDGELLRLLCYDASEDELVFNPRLPHHVGWNLSNSSPLYRGLLVHENVNKAAKNSLMEVEIVEDEGKSVYYGSGFKFAKRFKVDSKQDYLFSFLIKTIGELTVSLKAFDKNNSPLETYSYNDGEIRSTFFVDAKLLREDKYLPVSLNILNSQKALDNENATSINQGNDLKLDPKTTWIDIEVSTTSESYFDNIKLLLSKTPYSSGFMQTNNVIDFFGTNKNHRLSFKDIYHYIVKYLIPYNSNLLATDLSDVRNIDQKIQEPKRKTKWIGGKSYCEQNGWRPISPACETIDVSWIGDEETAYCKKIEI